MLNPDPIAPTGDPLNAQASLPRPTTTTVVRGSAWFLAGRAFSALAALLAIPLLVRLLGPERYGLYVLMLLLIGYAAAADVGMGVAAIRFASQFQAQGKSRLESDAVWSAAWLSAAGSLIVVAVLEMAPAFPLEWARVDAALWQDAMLAVRVTGITILLSNVGGVFVAPQLSRMRYALNSSLTYGANVLRYAFVCIALLVSVSLTSAAAGTMTAAFCVALLFCWIAIRIAPEMRFPTFNSGIALQMLPFGAATAFSSLVTIALSHGEKLLLARLGQLSELAYYAIAFSVAGILMMLPHAMAFAALPAFTRLLESAPGDSRIYDRLVRANLLGLIPVAVGLVIAIRPFLYYWAGPAFADHSTTVFRILVVGFLFFGLREMPYQALVAAGRTGTIARIQLLLIVPYIPLAIVLVGYVGITGAAIAWSMQTVADAVWMFIAARRLTGWRVDPLRGRWIVFVAAAVIVALPAVSGELIPGPNGWRLPLDIACLGSYALFVWFAVLAPDERAWLKEMVRNFVMRRPVEGVR